MLDLAFEAPKPKVISGATHDWELVIGMEVHAQVASQAKLFSGASTAFGSEPNSNVSFVDAAMPGMLPVINEFCVEQAVRTGLGLKARINLWSAFDRKNYFYPDLPQGYQISQLYHPIVGEGEVIVDMGPGIARRVRIERIHLEQDAGKSHPRHGPCDVLRGPQPHGRRADGNRLPPRHPGTGGGGRLHRQAAPDPALPRHLRRQHAERQPARGRERLDLPPRRLRALHRDGRRRPPRHAVRDQEHELDALHPAAIEYEARRQIRIVEGGGKVDQETRLYDPDKGETRSMRSKEEAHDYRYFPDPDLLPLEIEQAWVDGIAASLPELPDAKKARFVADFGLTEYDAGVLTAETEAAAWFEAVAEGRDGKQAANWVINELFGRLKKDDREIGDSPVSPAQLGAIIDLIAKGDISGKIAKDLFEIVYTEGGDPAAIVEARGMRQVTDTGAIEAAVDDVIAANPDQVEKAKANPKLAGWFVGQVMKATGGKANPKAVNDLVMAKLGL